MSQIPRLDAYGIALRGPTRLPLTAVHAQQEMTIRRLTPGEARQRELQEYDRNGPGARREWEREQREKDVQEQEKIAIECSPMKRAWHLPEYKKPMQATFVKVSPSYAWFTYGPPNPKIKNAMITVCVYRDKLPLAEQVMVWERANAALKNSPKIKEA